MPKATLTFNLPDEQYDYQNATNGGKWHGIAYDISMFLRNKLKYGHDYKTADEALEAVKSEFWDLCQAENLDPWES